MNPKAYGALVEGVQNELFNDFDDLLHGFYDHKPQAPGIINDIILYFEKKGYAIDKNAEDDLLAFVDGFDVKRVTRFHARYAPVLPDTFYRDVILLLTLPYPNDVPVRKTVKRPEYIAFESEEEVIAFFTGGVHEDYHS